MSQPTKFNIIKQRGDPTRAITLSGHEVVKQSHVYFRDNEGNWQYVRCADYHNEHFLYIDPNFNLEGQNARGWFAMCTCGSPAVLVGPGVGGPTFNPKEQMLVCKAHTQILIATGVGKHQGQEGRRWD